LLTIEVSWDRLQSVLKNILALPSSAEEQWPLRPLRERHQSTAKRLKLFTSIHGVILYKNASLYQNVEHSKILFSFKRLWCSGPHCEVPLVLFKISLKFTSTIHSNFVKLFSVEMCNTSVLYIRYYHTRDNCSYAWKISGIVIFL
jgi:hypothetical protein